MDEKTVRLTVDIPESLHKRLRHQAIDDDTTVKDLVIKILEDNLVDSGDKHKSNIKKIMG